MRVAFRSCLLAATAATILLLPLLWVLRCVLMTFRWFGAVSVWTGAPIITTPKNCKAEAALGFKSISIVRSAYFLTNEFDYVLSEKAGNRPALTLLLTYVVFWGMCLFACQVHAFTDGGILPSQKRQHFSRIELFAYRLLGIRLLVWTYGGDVRSRPLTQNLGHPNCCSDCPSVESNCICDYKSASSNYANIASTATTVFSMGDMIEYTPGSRNDLFYWPIDLCASDGERYKPSYLGGKDSRPLRVVHAPNHRELKGSRYLIEAVEELQRAGVAIELILVEKRSNAEALEIYRESDVIFDQCMIGFHGYFALEAMALGKPVMCFIRKPEEYLLHPQECPIINCHVTTLKNDLLQLVERRTELEEIGRRGRHYVEKYFSLEAFAGRLEQAYRELEIMR